ncbi:MAG TPA: pitrilysin family protein, partial [Acidimicrobiales bacterium]|nr:pitrilysin family protein [Acidimicrobiales bacterium]
MPKTTSKTRPIAKRAAATKPATPNRSSSKPALTAAFSIERFTLDNGLRVVLSPDRSSPTVCIAVYYDVGFRSEPEGRTGFAHLFEHLMFEGSEDLDKMQFRDLILGNGGILNGSTRPDYTNYFEQLPSNALEVGLYLEASRMRSPKIDEASIRNQVDVVKEEIRVNVLNRPYGGVPFIHVPPVMFDTFNNAHNGYGSFDDLEKATVQDAKDFFKRYYAPGNAVLAVAGDLDVAKTRALIEKHFGDIPARKVPKRPSFAEPMLTKERRRVLPDAMAQIPMLVAAYRVPDPINALEDFAACVILADLLAEGEASRLYQRLVKQDRMTSHV